MISLIPRYSIDFFPRDIKTIFYHTRADASQAGDWLGASNRPLLLTWDGRTALRILLRMVGIKPGETVVVPAFTCSQVHKAILAEGGKPHFVGIQKGKLAPSIEDYAEAVKRSHSRIVIPISYWGYPIDTPSLKKIIKNAIVVQDCALSFGSHFQGQQDGYWADTAFFSFGLEKPFCLAGGGGIVFSKNFSHLALNLLGKPPTYLMYKNLFSAIIKSSIFNCRLFYGL
jgi:dTDP-4-amino-4,6-dideoxygalactose transaminase